MDRKLLFELDPPLAIHDCPRRATHAITIGDSEPRDWNQLGRRVLAEAWRRFTEDLSAGMLPAAPLADPVPSLEDQS